MQLSFWYVEDDVKLKLEKNIQVKITEFEIQSNKIMFFENYKKYTIKEENKKMILSLGIFNYKLNRIVIYYKYIKFVYTYNELLAFAKELYDNNRKLRSPAVG